MALKITIAMPLSVAHGTASGPDWLTFLLTFLVGAATALAVQLVVQFYVVPKVETRKRREDRWERNVLDLGDLLTTQLGRLAYDACVEQGKFRDLRQLENEPRVDQHTPAQSRERQARAAQHATWAFGDLLHTRIDWLIDRIRNHSPAADEIVRFNAAARHYRTQTIFVRGRPQDDERTESDFEKDWEKERAARHALVEQVEHLADLPHPPRASRRRRGAQPAGGRYDLLGGPDPLNLGAYPSAAERRQ